MSWDEYEAEGGGGVMEAGELLALHFFFRLAEHLGVEGFPVFEEMPEDARQVDSLAPARSALRAFASGEFLSRLPKPLKCAPWP